jgi:putative addiction module CopG family antidote
MTRRVAFNPALEDFVNELVPSGRLASDDEVVSARLRLLQDEERSEREQMDALREAWEKSIASGDYRPSGEFFDRLIAKCQAMAKAQDR